MPWLHQVANLMTRGVPQECRPQLQDPPHTGMRTLMHMVLHKSPALIPPTPLCPRPITRIPIRRLIRTYNHPSRVLLTLRPLTHRVPNLHSNSSSSPLRHRCHHQRCTLIHLPSHSHSRR